MGAFNRCGRIINPIRGQKLLEWTIELLEGN